MKLPCRGILASGLLTAGSVVFSATPVAAASITYQIQPFAGSGTVVSGDTLDPVVDGLVNANGEGTGAVRARHGFIGAYAEAIGQFDVLTSITFQDQLTVVSGTLAFGEPVAFDLIMGFSWVPPTATGAAADASISGSFSLSTIGVPGSQVVTELFVSARDGITTQNTTATLHTTVGALLGLTATINTTASAGNCCQTGHAVADAFNTLNFYVNPAGDTFGYTSETGEGYLQPAAVPEPSTLILSLLGLGMTRMARLRKR